MEFSDTLGSLLMSRFKEREDNVKWDIFHAYTQLLCQIKNLFPNLSSVCLVRLVVSSTSVISFSVFVFFYSLLFSYL